MKTTHVCVARAFEQMPGYRVARAFSHNGREKWILWNPEGRPEPKRYRTKREAVAAIPLTETTEQYKRTTP